MEKILDAIHRQLSSELENAEEAIREHRDWQWHDEMPSFEKYAEVRKDLANLKMEAALHWIEEHEKEITSDCRVFSPPGTDRHSLPRGRGGRASREVLRGS